MRNAARLLLLLLIIGLPSPGMLAQSQPAASCDGCMVDRVFNRSVAEPKTETVTFTADPAADYIIDVDDQGSQGANATVTLNGMVIVTPTAVAGSARFHLRQAIRLRASNSLVVRLTGMPGSTLKLTVVAGARLVDQAGGTIHAPDGTTVNIPADALSAPTEIHVIRLSNYLPPASLGLGPLSTAWRLEPSGLEFAVPVTMRVETGGLGAPPPGFLSTDLTLIHIPADGSSGEVITPTFVDEGRVAEFTIHHFSVSFPWFGGYTDAAHHWRTSGVKWGVSTIEWYLEPPSITSFLTPAAVAAALAQWQANSGLRFHQSATKASANLVFVENGLIDVWHQTGCIALNDNYGQTCFPSFDAYLPSPTLGANDQVTIYMASTNAYEPDFLSSVLHEIGHAVGIAHPPSPFFWLGTADPDANVPVMNTGSAYPTSLRPADIDAAQYLYGTAATTITIQIERVSDTVGVLTGMGTLPATCSAVNCHILSLMDPFGTDPLPSVNNKALGASTTLAVDSFVLNFARTMGPQPGQAAFLYVGGNIIFPVPDIPRGGSLSGAMDLLLTDCLFAPVGATGDVYWGLGGEVVVGTWIMVAPKGR